MIIAPSLLAADFGKFAKEAARIDRAGADWLHLDIMDGHLVPNISFGPATVSAVRKVTKLPFDVHLMCSRPEILFEPFVKAGADRMTIHVELGQAVDGLLWKIRSLGKPVGLAINPPTSINTILPYIEKVNLILIMTVNPGFGGQPFIEETIPKIQQVAEWRSKRGLKFHIEVDGGINYQTAAECARAGADCFVSGTGLLAHGNLKSAIKKMRKIVTDSARL
ncbi:MAG: ribulose-phosphate 3-epimerase [Verrucomicrobiota bacterium]|nr:ribulose-phosphate 3-epimerase [Verrucomicrobiota bacterium]